MSMVFSMKIKFFKNDTFESDTFFFTFKSVTFEIFGKCSESVGLDANNDLHEDLKTTKDFVSSTSDVHNHSVGTYFEESVNCLEKQDYRGINFSVT